MEELNLVKREKTGHLQPGPLGEKKLKRLKEHCYSSTGTTVLDPYMQKWWEWVVLKLPLWLAPNLMTLTGLLIIVLTAILFIFHSPDAKQDLPPWLLVWGALAIFTYQTLDACDGKQARRTQTQSQLGELFDHGCDSVSTIFIALIVATTCKLGTEPTLLFFECSFAICLFYTAHWQTYVSGTLRFGKFDVTEIQFSIMFMLIMTAIFGPSIWSISVPVINLKLSYLPVIGSVVGGLVALYDSFAIILTGGVGKNGSSVAGTSVLSPSIPLMLFIIPAIMIWQKSPTGLYENNSCLYLLFIGLIGTKITLRLIICHMSRSEVAYYDSSMNGLAGLILNQYFDCYLNERWVLTVVFLYTIYDLINYSRSLCCEISAYLNIYTFSVTKREPKHHRTSSSSGNALLNVMYSLGGSTRKNSVQSNAHAKKSNGRDRKISRRGQ